MNCPYCNAELEGWPSEYGEYHGNGYGNDSYWEEFHCDCPNCGKTFRAFEDYIYIGQSWMRLED